MNLLLKTIFLIVINVDVVVRQDDSVLDVSFRDYAGSLCFTQTKRSSASFPLVAECQALILATQIASRLSQTRVLFECDCQVLCFDVLDRQSLLCWRILDYVLSLRSFFSSFSSCSLKWVPRRQNNFVHLLAKWADLSSVIWPNRFCSVATAYFVL